MASGIKVWKGKDYLIPLMMTVMRFQTESPKAITREATAWEVRICGSGPGPRALRLYLCEVSQSKSMLSSSPKWQLEEETSEAKRLQIAQKNASDTQWLIVNFDSNLQTSAENLCHAFCILAPFIFNFLDLSSNLLNFFPCLQASRALHL